MAYLQPHHWGALEPPLLPSHAYDPQPDQAFYIEMMNTNADLMLSVVRDGVLSVLSRVQREEAVVPHVQLASTRLVLRMLTPATSS